MKKIILIVCFLILMPSFVSAAIINIPGDQSDIQTGIDVADDGDTVLIADGTYTGVGNFNINFNGKKISVRSFNGPENCIIDCQQMGRGFTFENGEQETSSINGVTIINGYAEIGGGVYIYDSSPQLSNVLFINNTAEKPGGGGGGAIYSNYLTTCDKCTFNGNSAYHGGAIYGLSSLNNCIFTNNSAYCGGAVYIGINKSGSDFKNCSFVSNHAFDGGAIYNYGNKITFDACEFNYNYASSKGGAFYANIYKYSGVSNFFQTCIFNGNSSVRGGVIWADRMSFEIRYCTFVNNTVNELGLSIYSYSSRGTISGSIFWNRGIIQDGQHIYEGHLEEPVFLVSDSNIQGGYDGARIIDIDPLFVDGDNDDFHLQNVSPCIDTGCNGCGDIEDEDFDGNSRLSGAGSDMGAYELPLTMLIDSFTVDPRYGVLPLEVDFECISHDEEGKDIIEYRWNFGDGDTFITTSNNVQHIYNDPGQPKATCWIEYENNYHITQAVTLSIENETPIAVAGLDQIIPSSYVQLNGSMSRDAGGIDNWEWSLAHTEDSIWDKAATGETVTVSNLHHGNYIITLTVTDIHGAQDVDEMYLSVAASEEFDQAVYDAGYKDGYEEGLNNSYDNLDEIIEGIDDVKVVKGPLVIAGLLIIQESYEKSSPAESSNSNGIPEYFRSSDSNIPPLADAGSDQIIPFDDVELNGNRSLDLDGSIVSWSWSLKHVDDEAWDLVAEGETISLSGLHYGYYDVTLSVTDDFGDKGSDAMHLAVANGDPGDQENYNLDMQKIYSAAYIAGLVSGLNDSGKTIAGNIDNLGGERSVSDTLIINGSLSIE